MPGAVTTSTKAQLAGWARLSDDPNYPVTVHLVAGTRILSTAIADQSAVQPATSIEEAGTSCWFDFDLTDLPSFPHPLAVLVGESGEILPNSGDVRDTRCERQVVTYRDGLASGLSFNDVVAAFYLDILRRPVDGAALAHLRGEMKGHANEFSQVRKSLLDSEEYKRRRKTIVEAAGGIFKHGAIYRSAEVVLSFEALVSVFLDTDLPFTAKLVRFFPGLLLRPEAQSAVLAEAQAGIPERELFFRSLAKLADRPALVLDASVLSSSSNAASANEEDAAVHVPCSSPFFLWGWHKVEAISGSERKHRWMRQIGVIEDPTGGRAIDHIEVEFTGGYANHGRLFAASDTEELTVAVEDKGELGFAARITRPEGGAFVLKHLVLLSERATTPLRLLGVLDPRLISINVVEAVFRLASQPVPRDGALQ